MHLNSPINTFALHGFVTMPILLSTFYLDRARELIIYPPGDIFVTSYVVVP